MLKFWNYFKLPCFVVDKTMISGWFDILTMLTKNHQRCSIVIPSILSAGQGDATCFTIIFHPQTKSDKIIYSAYMSIQHLFTLHIWVSNIWMLCAKSCFWCHYQIMWLLWFMTRTMGTNGDYIMCSIRKAGNKGRQDIGWERRLKNLLPDANVTKL